MSDGTELPNPADAIKAAHTLERRRAALAKARAAPRKAKPRTAEPRTAREADIGVIAHPGEAQRRDAPTRDSYRPEVPDQITRRSRAERDTGSMDIPRHLRKPGWDYQYIAITVLNQPVSRSEIRDWHMGGWRPVLARDMPEYGDMSDSPDMPIEDKGLRLMTRPMTLTMEAREEDQRTAYEQQYESTKRAAAGQSAQRGAREEGIPNNRVVRSVPVSFEIEGLAG